MIHHREIEAPPEGLLGIEIAGRIKRESTCSCAKGDGAPYLCDMSRAKWHEDHIRTRRFLPGETAEIWLYTNFPSPKRACLYSVKLIKPKEEFDIIDAVNHDEKKKVNVFLPLFRVES
jgi:hypothetical protein